MTGEQITRRQIADQLRRCARLDGRVLDPQTFEDWYDLLGDLPFEDVRDAIREHYRSSEKWIMPAHIVAYHERAGEDRAVEEARQHPPACWGGNGCGVKYVLSDRPGSTWALPDSPHADGCRAMQGVMVFSRERTSYDGTLVRGSWSLMTINPDTFDEVRWEAEHAALNAAAAWPGRAAEDHLSRLAIGGDLDGDFVD